MSIESRCALTSEFMEESYQGKSYEQISATGNMLKFVVQDRALQIRVVNPRPSLLSTQNPRSHSKISLNTSYEARSKFLPFEPYRKWKKGDKTVELSRNCYSFT